ncbi:chemotaxis protein CheD [Sphingosinicella sp. BN140058]|uniref:chemotaxis protein CheD n=1 Tax=Sphingosinicella sp. BN140058 TaxID=1892855 RepID=UPI0010112F5C|nr:chemotaxis protein CheD [Sphingosinicella sp. BN140058]QAY76612.1 chemotaxis protein CheD [Sphingosinicella sp. BN140058]
MKRIPIIQGEHKVVAEPDVMITTLLGSCIAVCLQDRLAKVGGMNHFLLAEPTSGRQLSDADMQCYGIHAMELLINEMMKRGAIRSRMSAQLYGGANVVSGLGTPIGTNNAAFARRFLEVEGISVGHTNVGGRQARKVEFLPYLGKARCTYVGDAAPVAPPTPVAAVAGGDLELF